MIEITQEQMDLIFRGVRPDDISKEIFDALRRDRDKHMKLRKKGFIYHNSKTDGPYVKK